MQSVGKLIRQLIAGLFSAVPAEHPCVISCTGKKRDVFYLHKKHKNLVPKIAASLKDMKREGKYSQIADPLLGNQE